MIYSAARALFLPPARWPITPRILLVCSENSLNSRWVNREIEMALLKEEGLSSRHVDGVIALIPVVTSSWLSKTT
jgi:hypothetical protein